jgi:hypothetical protein
MTEICESKGEVINIKEESDDERLNSDSDV